ncbi:hypothetical protein PAPYR_11477 [Paratrimastix pyriformis]|uniref:Uncharacterized protein n=1 Tax=Paratrimastix pyriformis TaxID=342808 RepID=A0ABQ8U5F6_9EUKA|nr:hypothetical protein PAPYR_11477 [Paratrimastix pyriformis]
MSKKEDNRIQRNLVGAWGKLPPRDLPPGNEPELSADVELKKCCRTVAQVLTCRGSSPQYLSATHHAVQTRMGTRRVVPERSEEKPSDDQYIRAKGMRHPEYHPEFHSPSEA